MRLRRHEGGGSHTPPVEPWDGDPNSVEWAAIWKEDRKGFIRFSVSLIERPRDRQLGYLIAEYASGGPWVVGFIDDELPDLPRYVPA